MNQCPQCKNFVDPNANVCPYCGFNLKTPYQIGYQQPYQQPNMQVNPPINPQYDPVGTTYPDAQTTDYAMYAGIAGMVLGFINFCSWIIPLCGCPMSLIGLGISAFGITSKNNKIWGIIGAVINFLTLGLSIINSIFGILNYRGY